MSFQLEPVVFNPKAPAWMKASLEGQQSIADMKFLDQVNSYLAAARDWVTNESLSRESSPNPAAYVVHPFTKALPKREVFDGTAQGQTISTFKEEPGISAPVLPSFVAPAPATPPSTDVGDRDAADDAFKAQVMTILMAIKTKLNA